LEVNAMMSSKDLYVPYSRDVRVEHFDGTVVNGVTVAWFALERRGFPVPPDDLFADCSVLRNGYMVDCARELFTRQEVERFREWLKEVDKPDLDILRTVVLPIRAGEIQQVGESCLPGAGELIYVDVPVLPFRVGGFYELLKTEQEKNG